MTCNDPMQAGCGGTAVKCSASGPCRFSVADAPSSTGAQLHCGNDSCTAVCASPGQMTVSCGLSCLCNKDGC
ncbi:MAG: hypothetical protein HY744_20505 [Deltaproteobacteria bacterium]|nr:hypothetical protein [Deltaproteobacteria bacterium]